MMKPIENHTSNQQMYLLCENVRTLAEAKKLEQCKAIVCQAMAEYPDAAEPHNLYGILEELSGRHVSAMKRFRAAWSLNPAYAPARKNMDTLGSFTPCGCLAYSDSDCMDTQKGNRCKIEYDEHGVGRVVVRRHKNEMAG